MPFKGFLTNARLAAGSDTFERLPVISFVLVIEKYYVDAMVIHHLIVLSCCDA